MKKAERKKLYADVEWAYGFFDARMKSIDWPDGSDPTDKELAEALDEAHSDMYGSDPRCDGPNFAEAVESARRMIECASGMREL